MRALAALAVLAAAAAGEPMVVARGGSLEAFEVVVNLARVDHASPEALARSYAEFDAAIANDCAAHFARLGAAAHIDILRRYYAPELVRKQEAAYEQLQRSEAVVRCEVKTVAADKAGAATATIERTGARRILLELGMRLRGEFWWIERIAEVGEDGRRTERDLGIPPLLPQPKIGAAVKADLSSPEAALRSLHAEMARLAALRARSQNELFRHYFAIVSAFYGEEAATRAREAQKPADPAIPLSYEFGNAIAAAGGATRISVVARETVPGAEEKRSAVGRGMFDFRAGSTGEWRVVEELVQLTAEGNPEPRSSGFALLLR